MDKLDYRKAYKDLYLPKTQPQIIEVPKMKFIMIEGQGNPNKAKQYQEALEILYGLSYTIKMSKMGEYKIPDYFEYVVPPLEGLWWSKDQDFSFIDKDQLCWISMIRQPDFVTEDIFLWALEQFTKKKGPRDYSTTTFQELEEGLCLQIMHLGSYDDEVNTFKIMDNYLQQHNYEKITTNKWHHHEIYLTDPRKTPAAKNKTVLRYTIKEKQTSWRALPFYSR